MVATQFFAREITLALDRQISNEAMARRLAEFSKERLAEVIRSGEGSPLYTTIVNGRRGAREESVAPPGPIIHEFNRWGEVLVFATEFLRARSPVGGPGGHKGREHPYRDSFFVLANGREVHRPQWDAIGAGAEILIGNDAPYSRKIDVQLVGGRSIKVSVPPGIFEDAAQAVRARFRGLVDVSRLYTIAFRGQYKTLTGPRRGRHVHSPALKLAMRS